MFISSEIARNQKKQRIERQQALFEIARQRLRLMQEGPVPEHQVPHKCPRGARGTARKTAHWPRVPENTARLIAAKSQGGANRQPFVQAFKALHNRPARLRRFSQDHCCQLRNLCA